RSALEGSFLASSGGSVPALRAGIVSLRVAAIGRRPPFDFSVFAADPSASLERARLGSRLVWFHGGWGDTPVWSRGDLPAGAAVARPGPPRPGGAAPGDRAGVAGRVRPPRQLDFRRPVGEPRPPPDEPAGGGGDPLRARRPHSFWHRLRRRRSR